MTVVAQRITGLPAARVFGSGTVLDTSRLRWRLAQRAGVSTASVHADIVGEHGDSQFPVWSNATIGPVPILDWPADEPFTTEELDRIAVEVRDAAYAVIRGKGATNLAIGVSAARIAEAVIRDEHAVLPVSTVLNGEHGIDGVALSLPSVVSASGALAVAGTPMTPGEEAKLAASAAAIRASLDALEPHAGR
ncbi:hypothetical protein [Microbacterium sp. KUDC0406]|uniref:hypothetical protein n=1 Tax=Microbacterium sp. KUDC0406 TaxID=2909588 RepID=UPI003FA6052F